MRALAPYTTATGTVRLVKQFRYIGAKPCQEERHEEGGEHHDLEQGRGGICRFGQRVLSADGGGQDGRGPRFRLTHADPTVAPV